MFRELTSLLIASSLLLSFSCRNINVNGGIFDNYRSKTVEKESLVEKPLVVWMPSTNKNLRPEKANIDTIIIHHTAPFPSLWRVGYFFQMVNARVSAHYTVGKKGLIVQSLPEEERAWHGGFSSFLGKTNLNDYSIGIEILNDGDSKDPFTKDQYNALTDLVAYLVEKYDVNMESIVGHRDIGIPLGRKIDPADNFDWFYFKSLVQKKLNRPSYFWKKKALPKTHLPTKSEILQGLKSSNIEKRALMVRNLFTIEFKEFEKEIFDLFSKEESPIVLEEYFKLFKYYKKTKFTKKALDFLENTDSLNLRIAIINYLYLVDKKEYFDLFLKLYSSAAPSLKPTLINLLANYKNDDFNKTIKDSFKREKNESVKKAVIWALIDQKYDLFLLDELNKANNSEAVKAEIVSRLRITFDKKNKVEIEEKLLELLDDKSLVNPVLDEIAWVLLRKFSSKGIEKLTNNNLYQKLSHKTKLGLINTIGIKKQDKYNQWLLEKLKKESDFQIKSSIYLALGRIHNNESISILKQHFLTETNDELQIVILQTLSFYSLHYLSSFLPTILENKYSEDNIKLKALYIIQNKNIKTLLPDLEKFYNNTKNSFLKEKTKEIIKSFI